MPTYQKLVHDRIPEIIQTAGKSFNSRILSEAEFIDEVNKKMHEELAEYEHANSAEEAIEELADLLELIHAAITHYGVSFDELDTVRKDKVHKRGGFEQRIFLEDVEDD
ncbi:nucleoside triphosphate pyrophosphohydrolase [Sporosarcina sp. 179-K 3D1 HS]|uniref:phosphoribosyl-ATP pyrophosphohydrolase n=1 Tax=Sporosarcina sp. 179-K 3D1 HS TaxID=3232169 RepID=UPI0039A0EA0C